MIYIMSGYKNIDFMTFFDVRALKWPQNGPEPKNIKTLVYLYFSDWDTLMFLYM